MAVGLLWIHESPDGRYGHYVISSVTVFIIGGGSEAWGGLTMGTL